MGEHTGQIESLIAEVEALKSECQSLKQQLKREIDLRKKAELANAELRSLYQALVEQASDAFFVHDFEGRFIDVNHRGCEKPGLYKRGIAQHVCDRCGTGFQS